MWPIIYIVISYVGNRGDVIGLALITLTLATRVLAAAPRTLCSGLLSSGGDGCLGCPDGFLRRLGELEPVALPPQPVERGLPS